MRLSITFLDRYAFIDSLLKYIKTTFALLADF